MVYFMKCARYTTTYIYTYIFVLFYCRDAIQKPNVPAHIFYVTTFCILLHYASNNVLLYTIYFKCMDVLLCTSRVQGGYSTFESTRINDLLYTIHFIVLVPGCLDYTEYRCILSLPFVKKMYLNKL